MINCYDLQVMHVEAQPKTQEVRPVVLGYVLAFSSV